MKYPNELCPTDDGASPMQEDDINIDAVTIGALPEVDVDTQVLLARAAEVYPLLAVMSREQLVVALARELHDVSMLSGNLTAIYMHVTNGRISKPNTLPTEVISVMEELWVDRDEADDNASEAAFSARQAASER